MRFLVDAQLPRRLARWLHQQGYEATHTLDLPLANRTPDIELKHLSTQRKATVITKDSDFADNLLLHRNVYKLLLVSTGNISNDSLMNLFQDHLETILIALEQHTFVELSKDALQVRW